MLGLFYTHLKESSDLVLGITKRVLETGLPNHTNTYTVIWELMHTRLLSHRW